MVEALSKTESPKATANNARLFDIPTFLALHQIELVAMVKTGPLLHRLLLTQVLPPPLEHSVLQVTQNRFGIDALYYFAKPQRPAGICTSPMQLTGADFVSNFSFGISKSGMYLNLDHLLKLNIAGSAAALCSHKSVFSFDPASNRVRRLPAKTTLKRGDLLVVGIFIVKI
jgi:hypothetical protein